MRNAQVVDPEVGSCLVEVVTRESFYLAESGCPRDHPNEYAYSILTSSKAQ